ncbi:MAG: D-2-hydroxyacid dehydrogenase [Muribaculaceae bacterium]|nr:D-2-hydroxyacid dehydrogenase [Muribaculaceae bacterium]
MKIVVLDGYTINPGDLSWQELDTLGEVRIYDRTAPSEVVERCRGYEFILTNKTVITAEMLDRMPDARYIGVLATGTNVVDLMAATAHGITVTNIPAYSTESVAQEVWALILAIVQRVESYTSAIREGEWAQCADFSYLSWPLMELHGKTVGIVGFGNIGHAVARIARGFGMKVLASTSKPQDALPEGVVKADLDDVFRRSDIVTIHCPLTPETEKLVNAGRLALMKRTAILINTSRGGVVDETALAEALERGEIYGAGVDVLSTEPPKPDNPLLHAPHCVVTPHIAWATHEARARLLRIAISNILSYLAGAPKNVVN